MRESARYEVRDCTGDHYVKLSHFAIVGGCTISWGKSFGKWYIGPSQQPHSNISCCNVRCVVCREKSLKSSRSYEMRKCALLT